MELRTRYRIAFLYREMREGKCVDTPLYMKRSGAMDGDGFEAMVQFAEELYDTIPKKCLIEEGSGVCIVTYVMKEDFVYNKKIYHTFAVRKDKTKIAYQVDAKTGKKKQIKYKVAKKRHAAQVRREKKATVKHKQKKKKVIKQFQMFRGCNSPDMAYK